MWLTPDNDAEAAELKEMHGKAAFLRAKNVEFAKEGHT